MKLFEDGMKDLPEIMQLKSSRSARKAQSRHRQRGGAGPFDENIGRKPH
ncbi:MAG: hypothetical protein AB9903_20445 [Vulcanimicrobiota bacterium]